MKKTSMAAFALAFAAATWLLSCTTARSDDRGGFGGVGGMQGGPGGPPAQGSGAGPQGGDSAMGGGPAGMQGGGPPPGAMASASHGGAAALPLGSSYAVSIEGGQSRQSLGLRAAGVVIGGRGSGLGPVEVNIVLVNRGPEDLRIEWGASSIESGGSSQSLYLQSQKYEGRNSLPAAVTIRSGEAMADCVMPLSAVAIDETTGAPRPSPMATGPIKLRIVYNDTRDFAGADASLVVVLTPVSGG